MELEWLILADRADVVNSKLYLKGGGWDLLTINGPPPVGHPCGVGASFLADWNNDTNRPHEVELRVLNDDGDTIWTMSGRVEVGRPPGIRPGQSQRVQLAANLVLAIPGPGGYVVSALVNQEECGRTTFNVVPGPTFGQ
jgi:hypothetical protein